LEKKKFKQKYLMNSFGHRKWKNAIDVSIIFHGYSSLRPPRAPFPFGYILLFSFKINNLCSLLGCVGKALRAAQNAKSTRKPPQKKGANKKSITNFPHRPEEREVEARLKQLCKIHK